MEDRQTEDKTIEVDAKLLSEMASAPQIARSDSISMQSSSVSAKSSTDQTLDTPLRIANQDSSNSALDTATTQVAIIVADSKQGVGSEPQAEFNAGVIADSKRPRFDDETQRLLRSRLTWAALDLMIVLGIGYIGNLFAVNSPWLAFRTIMLVTIVASYVLLRTERPLSIQSLRSIEIALFGGVAVQVGLMMYSRMVFFTLASDATSLTGTQDFYLTAFCLHVLTYGTFIPNAWWRSVIVNFAMGMIPYGVWFAVTTIHPSSIDLLASNRAAAPIPVTLIAAMIGSIGSHIIYTSRREAFQAKQIMQYRLHAPIGSGGMGDVYRAEHVLLKRACAIKLIKPDKAVDNLTLHRFEREVIATAKLTHWNTIDIYDYGHTPDGTFYYVMELLEGENLQRLISGYGPMSPSRAVYLLSQACQALQEAHDSGLIHRDIKPANIFVTHRGGYWDVLKLLDFGLVKETSEKDRALSEPTTPTRTTTGSYSFSGTPLFMAPEQATRYEEVDHRSDIYALGIVAYFMVTGTTPFSGAKTVDLIIAHATQPPTPPSEKNPEVPKDVEAVILRCIEKQPDDRFQSATELYDALQQCLPGDRWTPSKAKEWWQKNWSS